MNITFSLIFSVHKLGLCGYGDEQMPVVVNICAQKSAMI